MIKRVKNSRDASFTKIFLFFPLSFSFSQNIPRHNRTINRVGALFIISITFHIDPSSSGRERSFNPNDVVTAKIMGIYIRLFSIRYYEEDAKIFMVGIKKKKKKTTTRVKRKIFFPSDLVKICVRDDGENKSAEAVGLS